MNIIEKLGITPGPWRITEYEHNDIVDFISGDTGKFQNVICQPPVGSTNYEPWHDNKSLILSAPEMLEVLIATYELFDRIGEGREKDAIEMRLVIEKATDKTWEEIHDLLNDEKGE